MTAGEVVVLSTEECRALTRCCTSGQAPTELTAASARGMARHCARTARDPKMVLQLRERYAGWARSWSTVAGVLARIEKAAR